MSVSCCNLIYAYCLTYLSLFLVQNESEESHLEESEQGSSESEFVPESTESSSVTSVDSLDLERTTADADDPPQRNSRV